MTPRARGPWRWRWLLLGGLAAVVCLAVPDLHPRAPETAPAAARPPLSQATKPIRTTRINHADSLEVRAELCPSPTALRIVWIGDTRARLDSCACHQKLNLTEASSVLRRLGEGPPRTILVDAGGAMDGGTALDQERTRAYAAVLRQLSFSALALGGGRGHSTREFVETLSSCPSILLAGEASARVEFGGRFLSFVCADSPPAPIPGTMDLPADHAGVEAAGWSLPSAEMQAKEPLRAARERGDFVVLVGDLSHEDALRIASLPDPPDVILTCRPMAVAPPLKDASLKVEYEDFRERLGSTSLYGMTSSSFGAVRSLELAADGTEVAYGMFQVAQKLAPDPAVDETVEAFFRRVSGDAALAAPTVRRFVREPLENDPTNGYVGSARCMSCHEPQRAQWQLTAHATATKRLELLERHYYPGCITCHSTGYGWESGYRPRDETRRELMHVGCETCHGPGRLHVASPKEPGRLRRGSPTLCIECHDGKEAQPLGERLEEAYQRIRH